MRATRALLVPALFCASYTCMERSAFCQANTQVEFSVQRFEPAPGGNNFLSVETLRMQGDMHWSVGLFFNYARNPFVVNCTSSTNSCGTGLGSTAGGVSSTSTDVVRNLMTWDLLASLSPTPWLQLGLRVPLTYLNGDGLDLTTGGPLVAPYSSLHAFGLGNPDLEAKVRLWGKPGQPLLLGVGADISVAAHSSTSNNFVSDSSPVTGGIRGIAEGTIGAFEYGANLRALIQKDVTIGSTTAGSEFRYAAAAGYNISPIFEVLAEGFGGTGFRKEAGTNSLELDGALRIRPLDSNVAITVGGGAGVLYGVGVPQGRAFVGLVYARDVGDQDHDGIPDDVDKCPTVPEDFDGFEDHDGCPEDDNDNDKIPDVVDKCPNEPETLNGFQDADGCPDEISDRDHDGIPDTVDKCPDAGGPDVIKNPKSPYYGCPDRDHDGVPDYLDKCPDVPEPTDDLFDGSGCPHVRDTDHDGIPDDIDKCPLEPETYNGYQDADGCPDKGPTAVEITETRIAIHDRVEFATGKDKIQGAKSFAVLDAVAGIMLGHEELTKVEIQGHTDNVGNAVQNRTLSQKRAEACVKYLIGKGVDASRLAPKGYGPDVPIGDNKTAKGRQENRRVDFIILENTRKNVPAGPPGAPAPAAPPPAVPVPLAPPPAPPAPKKH